MTAALRTRPKRQQPEFLLHKAAAEFLDDALPSDAVWMHVPNGGKRSISEATRFKRMGVKPGVADCIIICRGHAYAIELKAPGGSLSSDQKAWRGQFVRAGGRYRSCRSLNEIEAALREWGVPCRARVQAGAGWVKDAA